MTMMAKVKNKCKQNTFNTKIFCLYKKMPTVASDFSIQQVCLHKFKFFIAH